LPKVLVAVWRTVGIVLSLVVLMSAAFVIKAVDKLARLMVRGLELLTGYEIEQRPFNPQRVHNQVVYEVPNQVINEPATLANSTFPIPPEKLIEKAKVLISKEVQLGSLKPELLADDFQHVFPVVGPLKKEEFCTIFSSFKIHDALPNVKANYFGFTVDPVEPNRVWFFARGEGKHEGTLKFGKIEYPPTNINIVNVPQIFSFSFDEEGRVFKFTGGYPIDRTIGNTGGLGALFGIIHAIGGSLPFPEGAPWKPSLEWETWIRRLPQIGKEWAKVKN